MGAAFQDISRDEILASYEESFDAARQKFQATCDRYGVKTELVPVANGNDGICVAQFGPTDAPRKLVVLSGLHGVEGYCGSAGQIAFLKQCEGHSSSVHVILVHVINAAGARKYSRTTLSNIDLNRNLTEAYADHAKADRTSKKLVRLFSSRALSGLPDAVWTPWFVAYVLAHGGMRKLKNALAGGQYFDSSAPFFGGSHRADELIALEELLEKLLKGANPEKVIILDLHSGIGRFGDTALFSNGQSKTDPSVIFGETVASGHDGDDSPYAARGDVVRHLKLKLGLGDAYGLTCECGTGPAIKTLLALRAANSALVHFPDDTAFNDRAKSKMIAAFCPRKPDWRVTYVDEASRFMRRALDHLSGGLRSV